MKKLILISIFIPLVCFSKEPSNDGNTYTVVSKDAPYTPTSSTKHNYRYRAVFYQDYHNEVPGGLYIEKIQRPDSMGSPFKEIWKTQVRLDKIPAIKNDLKKLGFESRLGCCDFVDLKWDEDFKLRFSTTISKNRFSCVSSDVRKGKDFSVQCGKK